MANHAVLNLENVEGDTKPSDEPNSAMTQVAEQYENVSVKKANLLDGQNKVIAISPSDRQLLRDFINGLGEWK